MAARPAKPFSSLPSIAAAAHGRHGRHALVTRYDLVFQHPVAGRRCCITDSVIQHRTGGSGEYLNTPGGMYPGFTCSPTEKFTALFSDGQ
jgi:hypothetical protein